MERVPGHAYVPAIERAYQMIPSALHDRMRPDFLCGVDPLFVGLHKFEAASYGRSYRDTPHCAYPWHQLLPKARRRTTVVLPAPQSVECVVHELGHVLHESLRFEPIAVPLNGYAATNNHEAFAEAFTSWIVPGYNQGQQDPDMNALFRSLTEHRETSTWQP